VLSSRDWCERDRCVQPQAESARDRLYRTPPRRLDLRDRWASHVKSSTYTSYTSRQINLRRTYTRHRDCTTTSSPLSFSTANVGQSILQIGSLYSLRPPSCYLCQPLDPTSRSTVTFAFSRLTGHARLTGLPSFDQTTLQICTIEGFLSYRGGAET
jgi:hypothetical protein